MARGYALRNVASCALILAVVIALYYPVVNYPFVNYDDDVYVTENTHVRAGLSWSTVKWAFASTENANWHPLTWMSHAIDFEFSGPQPGGHHFTSLMLHAVNSVLLFLLALYSTKRWGPSLVLALLFAVHPLNVESVAWVAERKNVLSTFFFFLTLGAYGWYARKPHWTRYAMVVIFFVCGLMSKPMLVTLPFVLLLLDYWPLERIGNRTDLSKLVLEKLPLFVLSGISCVITFRAQQAGQTVESMAKFPLAVRLENAIVAYALYLWKTVWPAKLAVFYPHPGASVSGWSVAASMLALVAITGITVGLRSRKYILTGWLWFLGTLVPVIGLVQVGDQAMADRYAYVPLIGLFLMITWAAADFLQARRTPWPLSAAVSIGVLLALSATTHRQIGYWSSDTKLWSHTLAVTTRNSFAHRHVGWALFAANDTADALAQFREAIAINPNDPKNYVNLGLCLEAENQFDAAIEAYKKAVSLTSDAVVLATVYTDLGAAYAEVGKYPEAYESYNRALQFNPLFNAYFNRGLLFEKDGKIEEAIADYQHSAELRPTARGYLQLGRALQELNRSAEAHAAYEKARRLAADPDATP